MDPHDREVWVKMAFAVKSEMGEAGFDIWDEWGAQHPRPASEIKSTWKSAKPGGKVGLGSLIYEAKSAGWKDDSKFEKPSAEVIAQRQAASAQRQAQYEAELTAEQEAAAQLAQKLWDEAESEFEGHDYLTRKGVQSHGLKVGPFRIERTDPNTGEVAVSSPKALLVPLYDFDGKLWNVQAISRNPGKKNKRVLQDSKTSGCFFSFGTPQTIDGRKVFILGEGYATCASIFEDTGHMVLMCINSSNILNVAKTLRERDPDAIILIAADNDLWSRKPDGTPRNPGLESANKAAQAVGGIVAYPPFCEADATGKDEKGNVTGPKDFNDWHGINGPGSVAEVINAALATKETGEPGEVPYVVLAPNIRDARAIEYALMLSDDIESELRRLEGVNSGSKLDPDVFPYDKRGLERMVRGVRELWPSARIDILAERSDAAEARRVADKFGASVNLPPAPEGGWAGWGEFYLDSVFDLIGGDEEVRQLVQDELRRLAGVASTSQSGTSVEAASPAPSNTSPPAREVVDVHHMQTVDPFDWPNLSERMKPLNTIPNLRFLLDSYGFTVRYDVIRKDMLVTHPGQSGTRDNMRSKAIDTVISLCALNSLAKTDTPSFMMSIADDRPYNPAVEFITSKPWDGVSRLADLLATVETKPGFDRELFAFLMRRWLISAVAAVAMPAGFWSKGVLVFQGDQSLGKTTWFRSLLPQQLRDLMKVDASIDPSNKDTIISVVSHWLVELGELDGTLRKADIARLKGFISQDIDQFRRPYGRTEEKFQRRTVFFASVNPEQFLADDTGNVRWWTVPVTGVNSEHGIDMQQLWAEVYTLFQAGERWWLDRDEERLLNASNVQHEQRDPIDELIASKYDFSDPARHRLTATQVLLALGYQSPSKKLLNDATGIMRKHFGEPNRTGKGRFFQVPNMILRY
ncbi:hypothetical protein G7047_04940 [Diaphorobacter sp. HDW4A]|nr:hypothetical protein G7047_04940 [Diaphorobacter sp. HDW4A]